MKITDKNICFGVATFIGILIGIIVSLTSNYIRYNEAFYPTIVDIDPDLAYSQIVKDKDSRSNKIILIDVRSEQEYNLAHASSSVNLPIHYLYDDTHGVANSKGIPVPKNNDQEIYLLCTGGRLAGVAYSYLEHYGYRNIKRIKGGLKNWNDEGMPVITQSIFDTNEKSYNNSAPLDKPLNLDNN